MESIPPITYRDILDYQTLWGLEFDAWELDGLFEMDSAYRAAVKQREGK